MIAIPAARASAAAAGRPRVQIRRIGAPVFLERGTNGDDRAFGGAGAGRAAFAAALAVAVKQPSELVEVKGVNHFEIVETLGKPDGALAKVALKQMGLA